MDDAPAGRDTNAAARLQILATEHWSLLASRSLTYNEALSRVTIFLAILSGAVIALALVAQADDCAPPASSSRSWRSKLHAEFAALVAGVVPGRTQLNKRILMRLPATRPGSLPQAT